jgi:hypothetical protein
LKRYQKMTESKRTASDPHAPQICNSLSSPEEYHRAYLLSSRGKVNVTPMHGWIRHPCPVSSTPRGESRPEPPPALSVCKARQALSQTPPPCGDGALLFFSPPSSSILYPGAVAMLQQGVRFFHNRRHPFMTADGPFRHWNKLLALSPPTLAVLPSSGRDPKMQVSISKVVGACWPAGRFIDGHAGERGAKEGLLRARWSQMTREQQPTASTDVIVVSLTGMLCRRRAVLKQVEQGERTSTANSILTSPGG